MRPKMRPKIVTTVAKLATGPVSRVRHHSDLANQRYPAGR